jgi:PAS domain S-box-containing protein
MEELLLLTDPQFKVIFINPRVADVFGVTDEAASGRPLSEIVPLGEMPSDREESRAYNEVHARNGEGQEIVLSMNATALRDRGGGLSGWVFIGRDVTLEWERTERIAQSLAEKDTLLREVHHRVGNSLQLIISLLNLQADLLDDPSSQTVLEEATQRIILISRVYERAYNAENVSAIPIDEFFIDIARELKLEAATDRRITTLFDVEPLELDLQRAIPLTMVFTEIYQEALARLVAAGSGKIRLSLRPEDVADAPRPRRWHLAIVHDGDQEQRRQSGIVEALCAQLGAELSVIEQNGSADGADAEKGATVRLSFSV